MTDKINFKIDMGGTKSLPMRTRFFQSRRSGGTTARNPKYEGNCNDIKSYVFDCSCSWKAGKFSKNLREVIEYASRE